MRPFLRGEECGHACCDERRLRGEGLAALSVGKFCLELLKQASQQTNHAYKIFNTRKGAETASIESCNSN
jgi:hypothetical protein